MNSLLKELRVLGPGAAVPDGYVMPYYLADLKHRVSVTRVNQQLYAFDDLCSHDGAPLSSGLLTGTTLMCQCDASCFDVTTGQVISGPAVAPLGAYEVQEVDGVISVRI